VYNNLLPSISQTEEPRPDGENVVQPMWLDENTSPTA
jgi:hypothetical protein